MHWLLRKAEQKGWFHSPENVIISSENVVKKILNSQRPAATENVISYLVSSSRSIQIHSDCLHSKSATSAPILPPPRAPTLSLSSLLSPSFRANPYSSSQFRDLESSRQKPPPGHIGTSKPPDRNPPPGRIGTSKALDRNSRGPIGTSKVLDRNSRGSIGTSINSRPQKRFICMCFPPLLFVSGPRNRFSLALTIILHPYTQAYSMCLLFIYCINIITHIYIQIGIFIF
jgi:hypothetical protein